MYHFSAVTYFFLVLFSFDCPGAQAGPGDGILGVLANRRQGEVRHDLVEVRWCYRSNGLHCTLMSFVFDEQTPGHIVPVATGVKGGI